MKQILYRTYLRKLNLSLSFPDFSQLHVNPAIQQSFQPQSGIPLQQPGVGEVDHSISVGLSNVQGFGNNEFQQVNPPLPFFVPPSVDNTRPVASPPTAAQAQGV